MRILVIDYLSPNGHENFDKIHIEALVNLGHNLTLVGKKGQFDKVENKDKINIEVLPPWAFKQTVILNSLFSRLIGITTLLYIMFRYSGKKYDFTLFLCYDILSLFFFRTRSRVVLIDHNNIGQLDNKIKFSLTNWYNEEMHVCLNEHMQQRLSLLLPKHRIEHVPHGLIEAYSGSVKPEYIHDNERFLFCPVNRNFNHKIISNLLKSNKVKDYLKAQNIVLYTKPIDGLSESDFIHILNNRIPDCEYYYLIRNSIAVLLPYTVEFKYRCSGIFFECITNDASVLIWDNQSFSSYTNITDMYSFDDAESLIQSIDQCILNGKRMFDKNIFSPTEYWHNILKV